MQGGDETQDKAMGPHTVPLVERPDDQRFVKKVPSAMPAHMLTLTALSKHLLSRALFNRTVRSGRVEWIAFVSAIKPHTTRNAIRAIPVMATNPGCQAERPGR